MRAWLKAAIPPAAAIAIVATTLITHAVQQPDPGESTYLSPVARTGDGAATLADRLAQQGIVVERHTTTPEAIAAATASRGATLFVPAPEFVRPEYLRDFRIVPPSMRVVLVAPNRAVLSKLGVYVPQTGPRWTAAAPGPGCDAPFARGRAAVLRWQYAPGEGELLRCYQGAVVEVDRDGPAITLVGAPDAFRNDRQGEYANADFAAGLLGRSRRVIWLDLHEREPEPPSDPVLGQPDDPDQGDPGDVSSGDDSGSDDGRPEDDSGGDGSAEQRPDQSTIFDAFPPSFWAAALLVILALIAFAAASARRLGAPVSEPLPARVRAAETVRGLAGLYRRSGSRDASLTTVQAAAVRRLAAHYGLPPEEDAVSERVAAQLGLPPPDVRALLGDGIEDTDQDTDEDLAARAAAVQRLVRDVLDQRGNT